jgi:L,D-transpeptidase catalytic domain/Putative peptidoglycan binding domain
MRRVYVIGALIVLVFAGVGGAAVALASSRASLSADASALARVGLPLGGGRIESVSVVTGPIASPVPVTLRGQQIWPVHTLPAGHQVSIEVVVTRPSWISWLTGKTERLRLTLTTPTAHLLQHFLTLGVGAPLRLQFGETVAAISYGSGGALVRHALASPTSVVTLSRPAPAGSMWIAAAQRSWETSNPGLVTWFPAGSGTSAVASPSPGSKIAPDTPITLTFSKSIQEALGNQRPPVSPATPGSWQQTGPHTIVFRPEGYGYGLGATVNIGLPSSVHLIGGQQLSTGDPGRWSVPPGSVLRLHELLAMLGYLPLHFTYNSGVSVPMTPKAQETAAADPPPGTFSWAYPNVPDTLRAFWNPTSSGVMTRGAIMAFENDHGLTADGVAGQEVWRALIKAVLNGEGSHFGYTFVAVSTSSQRLTLWHNGKVILATPVNTGIASAPTATGTYPVFLHIASGTMSGTNPDGSHYHDPGIPWISYFNGGDALHGFLRAQYGSPQSLGCVEMPYSTAGRVWPYTPIGTLVHVSS